MCGAPRRVRGEVGHHYVGFKGGLARAVKDLGDPAVPELRLRARRSEGGGVRAVAAAAALTVVSGHAVATHDFIALSSVSRVAAEVVDGLCAGTEVEYQPAWMGWARACGEAPPMRLYQRY